MSFKYIVNTNTAITAADATTISEIDFKGVFKGQTRQSSFQLGNTGSALATFTVSAAGGESDVTDNVSFSTDGTTWPPNVSISGIAANEITPLIHVRYTPDVNDYTSSGTFLINVVES